MTCPQCQEAKTFLSPKLYHPNHIGEMHKVCPNCGLKYSPEPGFYFGASYVSYAICSAITITVAVAMLPFVNWKEFEIYFSVIVLANILLVPITYRLSRMIWMNFFFTYQKDNNRSMSKSS